MNTPGFTADRSLFEAISLSPRAAAWMEGDSGRTVIPQQLADLSPSWWCDVFPWLCAVCGPCSGGLQHCCEPGRYICTPFGYCYRQWLCYDRRC